MAQVHSIRFSLEVDSSVPAALHTLVARVLQRHAAAAAAARPGGPPAASLPIPPEAANGGATWGLHRIVAAHVAAQAVFELLQAAGVSPSGASASLDPEATMPPELELPQGFLGGDCPICLETLEPGQRRARPPCLHSFHGECLRRWLRRSASCPSCKLPLTAAADAAAAAAGNAGSPQRRLRFRPADLRALHIEELRHLVRFLGAEVEREEEGDTASSERSRLLRALLAHPRALLLAKRASLASLPEGWLAALAGGGHHSASSSLEEAVLASGRFEEDTEAAALEEPAEPEEAHAVPRAAESPPVVVAEAARQEAPPEAQAEARQAQEEAVARLEAQRAEARQQLLQAVAQGQSLLVALREEAATPEGGGGPLRRQAAAARRSAPY